MAASALTSSRVVVLRQTPSWKTSCMTSLAGSAPSVTVVSLPSAPFSTVIRPFFDCFVGDRVLYTSVTEPSAFRSSEHLNALLRVAVELLQQRAAGDMTESVAHPFSAMCARISPTVVRDPVALEDCTCFGSILCPVLVVDVPNFSPSSSRP